MGRITKKTNGDSFSVLGNSNRKQHTEIYARKERTNIQTILHNSNEKKRNKIIWE